MTLSFLYPLSRGAVAGVSGYGRRNARRLSRSGDPVPIAEGNVFNYQFNAVRASVSSCGRAHPFRFAVDPADVSTIKEVISRNEFKAMS
ncbi:hypothetical protein EVAR_41241_1 [Eumeta japonica]|uniref:Uncharacterized protein n=1 Tax=Eumeta variegata TaxID=151549 RepID=A0A4C1W5Y6_EUMVA|nr:hypothetical protein EVAR_41241_1 [Eumeta japonica]